MAELVQEEIKHECVEELSRGRGKSVGGNISSSQQLSAFPPQSWLPAAPEAVGRWDYHTTLLHMLWS